MKNEELLQAIYRRPLFTDICRFVGYQGTTWRALCEQAQIWAKAHDKQKVEQAVYWLVEYEGQNRTDVKPLAAVTLRPYVRRVCHQLLGRDPLIPETDMVAEILRKASEPKPAEPKKRSRKKAG